MPRRRSSPAVPRGVRSVVGYERGGQQIVHGGAGGPVVDGQGNGLIPTVPGEEGHRLDDELGSQRGIGEGTQTSGPGAPAQVLVQLVDLAATGITEVQGAELRDCLLYTSRCV